MSQAADRHGTLPLLDSVYDLPARTPTRRYLLIASPQAGAEHVASVLHQTGEAGVPLEYLHPAVLKEYIRPERNGYDPGPWLDDLMQRRSSANGVFGATVLLYPTLARVPALDREAFLEALLGRFDRFVFIRRRDKIAQGVAIHRAELAELPASPEGFDYAELTRCVEEAVTADLFAREMLERLDVPYRRVFAEDLASEAESTYRGLFEALGLATEPGSLPGLRPESSLHPTPTDRYKAWLGGRQP